MREPHFVGAFEVLGVRTFDGRDGDAIGQKRLAANLFFGSFEGEGWGSKDFESVKERQGG